MLHRSLIALLGCVLGACVSSPRIPAAAPDTLRFSRRVPDYWPTSGWRSSTPEAQGLSSLALAEAVRVARDSAPGIHSLLVIRNGYVILDASFYPFRNGSRHDVASVTKSVTSLAVGMAIADGDLASATESAFDRLNTRAITAAKRRVTYANLLGMQSGFDCGFKGGEQELQEMKRQPNWIDWVATMPQRYAPGSRFGYCSSNYHVLSAALGSVTGQSEREFVSKRLFEPLGIDDVYWPADPQGNTHGWGDLQLVPSDLAKVGFLLLNGGAWDGRRIVRREWILWSTAPRVAYGGDNIYGYGWWTHPDSPPGFYEAIGRGGQRLSVWPEKEIIVVTTGGGFRPSRVAPHLIRAIVAPNPIPPDSVAYRQLREVVRGVAQAPRKSAVTEPASQCDERVMTARYRVAANPVGLRAFQLRAVSADVHHVQLAVDRYDLSLPVGLDGQYRFSEDAIDDVLPASRGEWAGCTFRLELNLVGKIDTYRMDFDFSKQPARVRIVEQTGLVSTELEAVRDTQ